MAFDRDRVRHISNFFERSIDIDNEYKKLRKIELKYLDKGQEMPEDLRQQKETVCRLMARIKYQIWELIDESKIKLKNPVWARVVTLRYHRGRRWSNVAAMCKVKNVYAMRLKAFDFMLETFNRMYPGWKLEDNL